MRHLIRDTEIAENKTASRGTIMALWLFTLFFVGDIHAAADTKIPKLSPTLEEYSYPYPVQTIETRHRDKMLTMAYMDIKPKNHHGRNVLLLHGKNFNGAYWKTTIESLTENGYRVIVPDQIGFGKSSKPLRYQYSFHQLAHNTKMLLDHLDIQQASVVGHSMGGMLATRFALMHPNFTRQLILVNPIGLEDYKTLVPYQPINWWYQRELQKNYESIKSYQKSNYYAGQWKPEYDPWVNILAGWTKHPQYKRVAWNSALAYDMIFTQPVVYEFPLIQPETLLIIGTRDRTALGKPLADKAIQKKMGRYDQLGKATQNKIPDAKLVELKDVGHLPHIEAFGQYIQALTRFLEKGNTGDEERPSKSKDKQ